MRKKYCNLCMSELDRYYDDVTCRHCKRRMERIAWFRSLGRDLDDFNMETTGSTEIDNNIKQYR